MDITRKLVTHYTPFFRAFLRDYCSTNGSTPAEEWADDFGVYSMDHDTDPASEKIIIMLFDRFGTGLLTRATGASTIRLTCSYFGDPTRYYEAYGFRMYDFDPEPEKPFDIFNME